MSFLEYIAVYSFTLNLVPRIVVHSRSTGIINKPLLKGGLEGSARVYSSVMKSPDHYLNDLYDLLYYEFF